MRILLTFDDAYAPHAAVVIESIIQTCPEKLDFVILHTASLSKDSRFLLESDFAKKVKSLFFFEIPQNEFKGFRNVQTLAHIKNPENVLLRLFCGRLPFDDIILYMDCDVIVFDDVRKVLEYADDNKIINAVTEYNAAYKMRDLSILDNIEKRYGDLLSYEAYFTRTLRQLDMDPYGKYFCAGVMLINLMLWKENKIGEKSLLYILHNSDKCFATDQDALNHILNGNYGELSPRWDDVVKSGGVFTNYTVKQLQEAYTNPAIVHFAGPVKPWHYMSLEKYRKVYKKYRKTSSWPQVIYIDNTFKNQIKKRILFPLVFHLKKFLNRRLLHTINYFIHYNDVDYFWSKARVLNKK